MYCSEITACLLSGMLTPAIRAIPNSPTSWTDIAVLENYKARDSIDFNRKSQPLTQITLAVACGADRRR
jgi:hypothetical protein